MMRRSLLSLAIHAILVLSEGVWALGLRSSSAVAAEIGGDGLAPSFAHGAAGEVVPPDDGTAGVAAEVVAAGPDLKTAVADLCKEFGRWAGRELDKCLSLHPDSCFDFRAFSIAMHGTDHFAGRVHALCEECHENPSWNGMPGPCRPCARRELQRPGDPVNVQVLNAAGVEECFFEKFTGTVDELTWLIGERAGDRPWTQLDLLPLGLPPTSWTKLDELAWSPSLLDPVGREDPQRTPLLATSTAPGQTVPGREPTTLAGPRRVERLVQYNVYQALRLGCFGLPPSQALRLTVLRSVAPFPKTWLREIRDQLRAGGAKADEAHSLLAEFCTATRRSSSSTTINQWLVAFLLLKFVFYLPNHGMMPRQHSEDLKTLLRTGELRIPNWFRGRYEAASYRLSRVDQNTESLQGGPRGPHVPVRSTLTGPDGHVRAARAALEGLRVLIGIGAGEDEPNGQELARRYRETVAEQLSTIVGKMAEQARKNNDQDVVDWIYSLAWETFDFLSETTGYAWQMPDVLAEALSRRRG